MMRNIILFTFFTCFIACNSNATKKPEEPEKQVLQAVNIIQGVGKVLPEQGIIDITSNQSGIIETLNIKAGDSIKKGDILLVLNAEKDKLGITNDNLKLETQKRAVQSAQTLVEQNKIELKETQRQLAISKRLLAKGAETQENVDNLSYQLSLQKQNLQKSINELALVKQQLKELENQKNISQITLNERTIKAPQDGLILDVNVHRGDAVSAFSTLASFAPKGDLVVEVEIDELFAPKVEVGQSAEINFIGYPETIATGKVIWVMNSLTSKSLFSNLGGEKEDRMVRKAKIKIETQMATLLIGAKVNCKIKLKE